ncbi:MAG: AAA-like domain-containing protein [Lachnospiraceae bacterium]|nr:AAA-like domain-containing protein [Lachnospiraceae bacterium]
MDFQMMSTANFADEPEFITAFVEYMEDLYSIDEELENAIDADAFENLTALKDKENITLDKMFRCLSKVCRTAKKPVVLMIDEVDSASNNQVFIDFLAQLRGYYLARERRPIFHSVILAGVYDIKNLKLRIRPDSEHQYNSPWNIAADFDIDMSFSVDQIEAMLTEYESDHHTGMDRKAVANEIYQYTSGYPYLVSAICKLMDEKLPAQEVFGDRKRIWTLEGVSEAVKLMMKSTAPLFDSLVKQLDTYNDLRKTFEEIIYQGKRVPFSPAEKSINLGIMFGFLREKNGQVVLANRIFEMYLMNLFITEESLDNTVFNQGERDRNQFLSGGRLNMDCVLEKFVEYFHDIYGERDIQFVEAYGRKFFLLYLKPIINGTGNYYLEAQTRDAGRTDVIVDYAGEQFIIEMKIWRGNEYNDRGEKQLTGYLEYFHQKKGYMLSFDFNQKKEIGVKTITLGDKTIVEAVV